MLMILVCLQQSRANQVAVAIDMISSAEVALHVLKTQALAASSGDDCPCFKRHSRAGCPAPATVEIPPVAKALEKLNIGRAPQR